MIMKLAVKAHLGAVRNIPAGGVEAYIMHPMRVAAAVGPDAKVVALLHDVLEDYAGYGIAELRAAGVASDELVDLAMLKRAPGMKYDLYIAELARIGSARAIAVKLADLADNMRDLPLGHSLMKRYKAAYAVLGAAYAARHFKDLPRP